MGPQNIVQAVCSPDVVLAIQQRKMGLIQYLFSLLYLWVLKHRAVHQTLLMIQQTWAHSKLSYSFARDTTIDNDV